MTKVYLVLQATPDIMFGLQKAGIAYAIGAKE
jgi:hypothetical protein